MRAVRLKAGAASTRETAADQTRDPTSCEEPTHTVTSTQTRQQERKRRVGLGERGQACRKEAKTF